MIEAKKIKFSCPTCSNKLPVTCVYTKVIHETEIRELIYYCENCCQIYVVNFGTGELIKTLSVKI